MSTYELYTKEDEVRALDINESGVKEKLGEFINAGFTSQGYVEAESEAEAIKRLVFARADIPKGSSSSGVSKKVGGESRLASSSAATYQSKYKTAQFVSKFMSIIGWLIFAVGILGFFTSIGAVSSGYGGFSVGKFLAVTMPSIGALVAGLFMVASAQMMKAVVDNADSTHQIFDYLKNG